MGSHYRVRSSYHEDPPGSSIGRRTAPPEMSNWNRLPPITAALQDATEAVYHRRMPISEAVRDEDDVGLLVGDHASAPRPRSYRPLSRRMTSRGPLRARRGQESVSATIFRSFEA